VYRPAIPAASASRRRQQFHPFIRRFVASSLVPRAAQVLWVSGDSTVQQGVGALIRAAALGRISVFTFQPGDVEQGAGPVQ
jgi:hypothetical protein